MMDYDDLEALRAEEHETELDRQAEEKERLALWYAVRGIDPTTLKHKTEHFDYTQYKRTRT